MCIPYVYDIPVDLNKHIEYINCCNKIYIYIYIYILLLLLLLSDLGNARVIIETLLLIETIAPLLT